MDISTIRLTLNGELLLRSSSPNKNAIITLLSFSAFSEIKLQNQPPQFFFIFYFFTFSLWFNIYKQQIFKSSHI